jgi:hypothetical protein
VARKRYGECSSRHRGNFLQTVRERKIANVTLPAWKDFFDFFAGSFTSCGSDIRRTTQLSLFQCKLCATSVFLSAMVSLSTYLRGAQFEKFKKTLSRYLGALESSELRSLIGTMIVISRILFSVSSQSYSQSQDVITERRRA